MLGEPDDLRTYCASAADQTSKPGCPALLPLVCQKSILSYINSADSELSTLAVSRERFLKRQ
jgi:hypothetical protein